jgi:hypothetical protein
LGVAVNQGLPFGSGWKNIERKANFMPCISFFLIFFLLSLASNCVYGIQSNSLSFSRLFFAYKLSIFRVVLYRIWFHTLGGFFLLVCPWRFLYLRKAFIYDRIFFEC